MAVEIERKFLVTSDGWKPLVVGTQALRQGYLSAGHDLSVRVRIADGRKAWLTVKGGGHALHRHEFEYDVPVADAEEMLKLRRGSEVTKRRHLLDLSGAEWVVDVFEGSHAGLVLCEVEFKQGEHDIELPDWLGDEVTSDPRYYNSRLAALPEA